MDCVLCDPQLGLPRDQDGRNHADDNIKNMLLDKFGEKFY